MRDPIELYSELSGKTIDQIFAEAYQGNPDFSAIEVKRLRDGYKTAKTGALTATNYCKAKLKEFEVATAIRKAPSS